MNNDNINQNDDATNTIPVTFINNDGGGFADVIQVKPGLSVRHFFVDHMGDEAQSSNYRIKVNGAIVPGDYELQPKDKISVTPNKVDGAR